MREYNEPLCATLRTSRICKQILKKELKNYITWIMKVFTELQCNFISFDDVLIDDMFSFTDYIQKKILLFTYWFNLLYVLVQFFIWPKSAVIHGRIGLIFCLLYLLIKIKCIIPKQPIVKLKLWCIIDTLAFCLFICHRIPRKSGFYGATINCSCMSLCLLLQTLSYKCIVMLVASIFFPLLSQRNKDIEELIFGIQESLMINFFHIAITHIYRLFIESFLRVYLEARAKAKGEIQSKNMFVASVSHDLKNPLNALMGCIDIVKNSDGLSEADKKHLKIAVCSGKILNYLIGNILDLSKIEAGKFDINRLPMSIFEEMRKILKIEVELAKTKGIKLYTRFLSSLPKLVHGDAMRFAQILMNLIGNSIKFTSKGYVGLVIRWAKNASEVNNYEDTLMSKYCLEGQKSILIPPENYFLADEETDGNSNPFGMLTNSVVVDDYSKDVNEGYLLSDLKIMEKYCFTSRHMANSICLQKKKK